MFSVTIKIRELRGDQIAVDINPTDFDSASEHEQKAAKILHKYLDGWLQTANVEKTFLSQGYFCSINRSNTEEEDAERLGKKLF